MPIKVFEVNSPDIPVSISFRELKKRSNTAFQKGTMSAPFNPKYTFEQSEYNRGREQDERLRAELLSGER